MRARTMIVASAVAAGLVVLSASFACAQAPDKEAAGKWGKAGKEGGQRWSAVMQELKLTPEQQQQLVQQRTREQEQSQQLRQQMQQVRNELSRELDKEKPDKAKAYALAGQMKELMGKRIEQRVDRIFSLREILTPEQFNKLNEKTKDFRQNRGGRREKFSHRDRNCNPDHRDSNRQLRQRLG